MIVHIIEGDRRVASIRYAIVNMIFLLNGIGFENCGCKINEVVRERTEMAGNVACVEYLQGATIYGHRREIKLHCQAA